MELFAKIVKNEKPFTIFVKNPILDIWQGSEFASEWLKINLNIKGNSNPLLEKNKKKEPTEPQNSCERKCY